MKKIFLTTIFVLLLAVTAGAEDFFHSGFLKDADYHARVGYSLGGSAPMGMPATIRELNRFPLTPNVVFGIDAQKPIKGAWGAMVGIRFENKGMSIDATVKNYHMAIVRGGESLEGMFTGRVVTKATEWMFTVPIQATYDIKNVRLKLGPYVSYLTGRNFSGYAYNGYLRVGDPTGSKVELGESDDERGNYDFTNDMRKFQFGLQIGADWEFSKRFGAFADLSWGLTGVHKSSFHTIEQTLYPIYGTIGLIYSFH